MANIIDTVSLAGLVPVIKVEDAADAVPLCKALAAGGLPVAEITFRSAAAEESIRNVHNELPGVILGAGTVLTVEQVDKAVAAGASYIVSPGLNPAVVAHCVEIGVPIVPGCSNPSDIEVALGFGIKTVKFFPAEALGGLKTIKAMSGPYGDVSYIPTGGINEKNMIEYLAFSKIKAVGGSWMVPADAIAAKDWDRIEALTANAVKLVLGFEVKHVGVNCDGGEQAENSARIMSAMFGWEYKPGESSCFAGDGVEFMKRNGLGTHGHIAVATNSLPRARWNLERKGIEFDESTLKVKNGKPVAIYAKKEIAGFAVHLLQK
ncbi:MAG: bifunctional 4-hydroxy-2-oxoglutarate aldolase/2-dehydro-3-deoxy-phosphogluconate aldolase [Clostridia bacterium]|nr:bifunctional 4-hydroxy-2-oxoglutarate aldolase/2-dehydro-3-deoxy-phosphogluconate aldolase [Clostridia bacterium]